MHTLLPAGADCAEVWRLSLAADVTTPFGFRAAIMNCDVVAPSSGCAALSMKPMWNGAV